jgi:hypothetical protein
MYEPKVRAWYDGCISWSAAMPYRITTESNFVRVVYVGEFTPTALHALIDVLVALDRPLATVPHRLFDVTQVTDWRITYADMVAVTERRRTHPPASPARSAVVATDPVGIGFGRMFQTLNDHPLIDVRIFSTVAEAEAWLSSQ